MTGKYTGMKHGKTGRKAYTDEKGTMRARSNRMLTADEDRFYAGFTPLVVAPKLFERTAKIE
jgi:hypothetical protein